MREGVLEQLQVALQGLDWDDSELEVKVAGTLKNDKFIVIKRIRQKLDSNLEPELKQKHPYNA